MKIVNFFALLIFFTLSIINSAYAEVKDYLTNQSSYVLEFTTGSVINSSCGYWYQKPNANQVAVGSSESWGTERDGGWEWFKCSSEAIGDYVTVNVYDPSQQIMVDQ